MDKEDLIRTRYKDPFIAKGCLKRLLPCEKCGSKEFTVEGEYRVVCKSCGAIHDNGTLYTQYPKYHWCDGLLKGKQGETKKEVKDGFYCVRCLKCGKKVEIGLDEL